MCRKLEVGGSEKTVSFFLRILASISVKNKYVKDIKTFHMKGNFKFKNICLLCFPTFSLCLLTKETPGNGKHGVSMVDLELSDNEQVERIFQNQNYRVETQMINIEKLMQPVLPPIKKKPTVPAYKTGPGLDRSVLEEIHNVMGSG